MITTSTPKACDFYCDIQDTSDANRIAALELYGKMYRGLKRGEAREFVRQAYATIHATATFRLVVDMYAKAAAQLTCEDKDKVESCFKEMQALAAH